MLSNHQFAIQSQFVYISPKQMLYYSRNNILHKRPNEMTSRVVSAFYKQLTSMHAAQRTILIYDLCWPF